MPDCKAKLSSVENCILLNEKFKLTLIQFCILLKIIGCDGSCRVKDIVVFEKGK